MVGAGPVGSLAALYAAQRGYNVEIYELRDDLRDPSTTLLNFTRSINLALSERGIHALRNAGQPGLLEHVFGDTIPMRGRMIHGKKPSGELFDQAQDYDAHGRSIYAIDRAGLNASLLDVLEDMPNVKFFFKHKLTGADFKACKAWFEIQGTEYATGRAREIEIDFDFMIGADGAHSAVRYHLMKYARMDYRQDYIDTLWCEFHLKPKEVAAAAAAPAVAASANDHAEEKSSSSLSMLSRYAISLNHLHIWPGKDFMFIAIPSNDGSFTCTLFMPSAEFSALEASPARLPAFFDRHFPGVTSIIPPEELIASFNENPHLPLISIKSSPYHFSSSAVIVGDAAHAMVPFYGQGMNAGLEDVRILFDTLGKHAEMARNHDDDDEDDDSDKHDAHHRALALAEYTTLRVPDAHSINDLALQNYVEMRSSVLSPSYRLRKSLEEMLSVHLPSLGWQTKYARVSFTNERYSEVVRRSDRQGDILMRWLVASVSVPLVATSTFLLIRYRRGLGIGVDALCAFMSRMVGRG